MTRDIKFYFEVYGPLLSLSLKAAGKTSKSIVTNDSVAIFPFAL